MTHQQIASIARRTIFCDRENDVYCPDCGKLILHREKEEHHSN